MKFGSFVVNLANVERPRFLKLEIWFQMEDDATKQAVVRNKSRIRHTIISYLSGLKVESTIGPLAKEEMSFAVKKLVNTILPASPITRVYFTEFVVN